MSAFEKIPPHPVEPVRVPKNNVRTLFTIVGVLVALAALVMIAVGFVDAGSMSPDESEGPAPPVVNPGTLPE